MQLTNSSKTKSFLQTKLEAETGVMNWYEEAEGRKRRNNIDVLTQPGHR